MSNHESGSFSSGFTLGLLAGAVGFFVFGTHKGKEVRKTLYQKWEQAKASAKDEWPEEAASIRDVWRSFITSLPDELQSLQRLPKKKSAHKKTPKNPGSAIKKPKQFSGV